MPENQTQKTDDNLQKYQKFIKHDGDKPPLSMLDFGFISEVAHILRYGANKYGDEGNWKRCTDLTRYTDAALRHLFAYANGEKYDPETGYHHLAHCACSLMFLFWFDKKAEKEGLDKAKGNAV